MLGPGRSNIRRSEYPGGAGRALSNRGRAEDMDILLRASSRFFGLGSSDNKRPAETGYATDAPTKESAGKAAAVLGSGWQREAGARRPPAPSRHRLGGAAKCAAMPLCSKDLYRSRTIAGQRRGRQGNDACASNEK